MMVTMRSCVYVKIDIYDPDRIYWLTQELNIKSESSMNIAEGRCIMHFCSHADRRHLWSTEEFSCSNKEKDHRLPASGDRLKFKCLNNLITSSNTEQLTTVHNYQLVLFCVWTRETNLSVGFYGQPTPSMWSHASRSASLSFSLDRDHDEISRVISLLRLWGLVSKLGNRSFHFFKRFFDTFESLEPVRVMSCKTMK